MHCHHVGGAEGDNVCDICQLPIGTLPYIDNDPEYKFAKENTDKALNWANYHIKYNYQERRFMHDYILSADVEDIDYNNIEDEAAIEAMDGLESYPKYKILKLPPGFLLEKEGVKVPTKSGKDIWIATNMKEDDQYKHYVCYKNIKYKNKDYEPWLKQIEKYLNRSGNGLLNSYDITQFQTKPFLKAIGLVYSDLIPPQANELINGIKSNVKGGSVILRLYKKYCKHV